MVRCVKSRRPCKKKVLYIKTKYTGEKTADVNTAKMEQRHDKSLFSLFHCDHFHRVLLWFRFG